jgi:hypothetical protein
LLLPLSARNLIPGRTPGTLNNSIGVNGHDGLLKMVEVAGVEPGFLEPSNDT